MIILNIFSLLAFECRKNFEAMTIRTFKIVRSNCVYFCFKPFALFCLQKKTLETVFEHVAPNHTSVFYTKPDLPNKNNYEANHLLFG